MKTLITVFVGAVATIVVSLSAAEAQFGAADVKIISEPGEAFDDAHRLWQGIPSIERTHSGRLVVAWYSGGNREGSVENYCLLAISDDQNRSWSAPRLVVQGARGVRTGEPLPWLDPRGRLWLFWNEVHPDKARRGTWAIRCDLPDAAVMQWTEPRFIGGGIVLGKPLVRREGDWLAPLDVRNDSPLAAEIGKNRAGVLVSNDEGATWRSRGGWQVPAELHDFDEHCVVERDDGSLWAVLRLQGGLMQSSSADGGATWTDPAPFMTGARTRAHLRRLASGRMLLLYHDGPPHQGRGEANYLREHLTAFLSDDEGRTWKHKLLLDPRNRVSYPDVTEAPDGRIYVTYDYGRYITGCKEALATSFTEADVLARRSLPTPALVNRATGFGNVQETDKGKEEKVRKK